MSGTTFCQSRLDGPDRNYLWLDGNDKITVGNGRYGAPKPNAFSLPAQAVEMALGRGGVHCPNATPACMSSCYVGGLNKNARETYELYLQNAVQIRQILERPNTGYWALHLATWITTNASKGFRWHVSGDLFSAEYASFVARVVQLSPTVQHWIYTRSFWLTAVFVGVDNITVNYSVDRDNYAEALKYFKAHEDCGSPVRLCYLTTDGRIPADLPKGSVIFPDYSFRDKGQGSPWFDSLPEGHKKMVCPVDLRGKSENRRCGPCAKCIEKP